METNDRDALDTAVGQLLWWADGGGQRCSLAICGDRKGVVLAINRNADYRMLVHTIASAMMQEEALLAACETAARYARRRMEEQDGRKEAGS